ncbi:hypothetical protein V1507DRAFT_450239 [Lipomyces tetrasporus]
MNPAGSSTSALALALALLAHADCSLLTTPGQYQPRSATISSSSRLLTANRRVVTPLPLAVTSAGQSVDEPIRGRLSTTSPVLEYAAEHAHISARRPDTRAASKRVLYHRTKSCVPYT